MSTRFSAAFPSLQVDFGRQDLYWQTRFSLLKALCSLKALCQLKALSESVATSLESSSEA